MIRLPYKPLHLAALTALSDTMDPAPPTFDRLMNPLLRALEALGGSGSVEEIYDKVVELEALSDEVLSHLHDPENSTNTEVWYRLAWARTYLKKFGLVDNSTRGVWSLTAKAKDVSQVDPQEVVRFVRAQDKKAAGSKPDQPELADDISEEEAWKRKLHAILTQKLSPAAFERLVQRVLRESGFTHVEVTGRSGDGGIDGRGIARIHGFMSRGRTLPAVQKIQGLRCQPAIAWRTAIPRALRDGLGRADKAVEHSSSTAATWRHPVFHVLFQCKRYKGSVSAGDVRDFRGAMVGRADKGLFISTGTFTPAAVKEATRDGAPPIDLVDGGELAEKLRELGLGVRKEIVEVARVDEQWFESV